MCARSRTETGPPELASAVDAPIGATAIPLRVTSYLAADPNDDVRLKLVLTGEASRVDPGEATFRVVVYDQAGTKVPSRGTADG